MPKPTHEHTGTWDLSAEAKLISDTNEVTCCLRLPYGMDTLGRKTRAACPWFEQAEVCKGFENPAGLGK